ncbi:hypothetical protein Aab01nite_14830 [Paractinoplanes abujensis]|uniref:Uncharacterized protein n=1 Tax=Paractinoplanes abujensis TaxID=882441 RepID=A0A7W7CLY1_9ACTN|nr:hypothetical protein [Actinoplanes abujensis]MBB4690694.1 hypothetical protein [Actinoplanes abujensis]GID17893.1 hypothetical protein Aab01nite_14830 [Actinoplanes abujensis]
MRWAGRSPRTEDILIAAAAAAYFVLRIWTYLTFAGDRLDFAATERSTTPLTATERAGLAAALHVGDPRWVLNLLIFGLLLVAAFSGTRQQSKAAGVREEPSRPVQGRPAHRVIALSQVDVVPTVEIT